MVGIKRGKVDDVFDALVGHEIEQFFGGRAVRVDKCDTLAILDILNRHVLKQCGFTHARLADDIDVFAAVEAANTEHFAFPACMRRRKIRDTAVIILMAGSHAISIAKKMSRTLLRQLLRWGVCFRFPSSFCRCFSSTFETSASTMSGGIFISSGPLSIEI